MRKNWAKVSLLASICLSAACSGTDLGGGEEISSDGSDLLLAPTQSAADTAVNSAYSAWKSKYVTSAGAGGFLRVQRTENSNDTVSEGIGYGMILAAYMGDKTTFDGLWSYAKSHLDANGLMNWQINSSNATIGQNAATDGDEDMALALIVADKKWTGYTTDAKGLIGKIYQYEVESGSNVLKPGDVWGGSSVTNPSYFAPGYYKAFRDYTGDTRWDNVVTACYQVLSNIAAKSGAGTTGLSPDWAQASGDPASGQGYNYTYDATRTPFRLAVDAVWYNDARATAQLNKVNTFFSGVGAANIKDGYNLAGGVIGQWHNAAFVGPAAAASIISSNASYKASMWSELVAQSSGNYYNDSLRAYTLLFTGMGLPNPGGGGQPPPANNPPTVSLTAPANNASYAAPASITLTASASDSDGTVSLVEFFSGGTKLGQATSAPYSFTWSNVAAGTYTLTAKATDNGSAATTSSAVTVTVGGAPPPSGSLKLQYACGGGLASDNQIRPHFNIVNTGATSVPLSQLKIRYFYTNEGAQPQTAWCDWAAVGSGNVSGAFSALSPAKSTADSYIEVSFNAAAGSVPAGGQSGEVQIRFAKNNWSNYTQTNDYSFDATKTSYADFTHAALYQNGTLVWGAEP